MVILLSSPSSLIQLLCSQLPELPCVLLNFGQFVGLPFGRPALSAARTGPVVPAHSGDDQEQLDVEREFLDDALCPALRAPEGATSLS